MNDPLAEDVHGPPPAKSPREMLAGLHLLDHQIIDCDGMMAGNVDDLELDVGDDPTAQPPVVTAMLSGAGALARRLEGRLGAFVESVTARLTEHDRPARIPFEMVDKVGSHVHVTTSRDDLETNRGEAWARRAVIDHIPGAGHAPE
jgi:sporulation protein YlmC with PRC-barrel domain